VGDRLPEQDSARAISAFGQGPGAQSPVAEL